MPAGRGLGLVVAGLAAVQLSFGLGLGVAAWLELPGDAAAGLLYDGVPPTRDGLARLLESRRASIGRADRPMAHRDLGMAFLLEAERADDEVAAREMGTAAEVEFRAALRSVPSDPTSWAMLPFALLGRADAAAVQDVIRQGARLVPHTPDYALNRLAALLGVRDGLDPELDRFLDRTLVTAAGFDLGQTVALLRRSGFAEAALERLADDLELAVRVARALEDADAAASEPE